MEPVVLGSFVMAVFGVLIALGSLVIQSRSASVVLARDWQTIATEQAKEIKELKAQVAAHQVLVDEAAALQARVAALETALAAAEAKIVVLQAVADEAAALREKIECLELELSEVKAISAQQAAEIERLTDRVRVLEEEKHALEKELVRLTRENGHLLRQNGELNRKLNGGF